MTVESFTESNRKKLGAKETKKAEDISNFKKDLQKYECFHKLAELKEFKEACDIIKEDVYEALSFAPAPQGQDDWWARYAYGLKSCLERFNGYNKRYVEAQKELSK